MRTRSPGLEGGARLHGRVLRAGGQLQRKKKAAAAAFVGATAAKKESTVARRALDQSSRYVDLSLGEESLIKDGKHVLGAYIMKLKVGYDYLASAAHCAAESSSGG
jgi:hypothetical protein